MKISSKSSEVQFRNPNRIRCYQIGFSRINPKDRKTTAHGSYIEYAVAWAHTTCKLGPNVSYERILFRLSKSITANVLISGVYWDDTKQVYLSIHVHKSQDLCRFLFAMALRLSTHLLSNL